MDLQLTMDQTWLTQTQLFLNFLAWAFAPKLNEINLESQFTTTVFVSMATRSRNLDEQKPGVNIQTEGHTLTPPRYQNGPEEVFGSAPLH